MSSSNSLINTPVVFFPGTLCDERVFMPCWQQLNLAQRAYSPLQWADDLEQMMALSLDRLAYFEQSVHLVGFSMGAYIAALVALEQPGNVASLTLIGFDSEGLEDKELSRRKQALQLLNSGQYRGMSQAQLQQLVHSDNGKNQQLLSTIKQMAEDLGGQVLANQINATSERRNLTSALAKSAFPIHLLSGEEDTMATPDAIGRMQKNIPHSKHVLIANGGHMLPLEQAKPLAEQLQAIFS